MLIEKENLMKLELDRKLQQADAETKRLLIEKENLMKLESDRKLQ